MPVGLLLTRGPAGEWQGTACSVVGAGELVAEGGEVRGGGIKIVIGVLILGARSHVGASSQGSGDAAAASRRARAVDTPAMRFPHVLVVGAGQMGGGIAQVLAASGRQVSLHDAFPGAAENALETMQRSLEKLAEKGGADADGRSRAGGGRR